jgi:hypothetical protein
MSAIQDHIHPSTLVSNEAHYHALMRLANLVDHADEGIECEAWPGLDSTVGLTISMQVWMNICLLLIDESKVDTSVIRSLANRIWKGSQDDLFTKD